MTIPSLIFLCLFIGAHVYFGYKVFILFQLAKATRGPNWGGSRLDRIPQRIQTFLINVFGQKAVLRKKSSGIMHFTIFWGFLIITIGTVELFLYQLFPPFTFEFLGTTIYPFILSLEDTFTLLVLIAISYAFYRRHIVKPIGIRKSKDADIIIAAITLLMLSLIGMNAFRMIGEPKWFDSSLWFSSIFQRLLEPYSFTPENAILISAIFRWVHLLIVLAFLMYIPSSKHLHVLAAAPNTFLRSLNIPKGMRKINLEDEKVTSFGSEKITDLSWKDTLDLYACTECGRCQDACPAFNSQKPLSPKKLILDLKDTLIENKAVILKNATDTIPTIINEHVTEDVLWACTSCRACEAACPVFIEHTDKIYETRRNLVLMQGKFPAELQTVFKNIENNFSPWAMAPDDRDKWSEGLEVKTMAQVIASGEDIEYLFWVGCAGSFDDRNKKVSRALVSILKRANVKFAILGNEEKCTGDPARRMGNEYLAQTLIQENVAKLNQYSVKKVVTACPHCFNAIKNEWKDFDGNFETVHHTQLIARLIKDGKIKPSKDLAEQVTYHDSCYIGRWNNEYQAPREILSSIPSVKIAEMEKSGANGMCCGAGGGRMWMEETIGTRINIQRTEQALATNSKVIASNCPFCMTMITDGIKAKEKVDSIKIMDIAEIVEQSLG